MKYTGKLSLRNDFHDTCACVRVEDGKISAEELERAEKTLCGRPGCYCEKMTFLRDAIIFIDGTSAGEPEITISY